MAETIEQLKKRLNQFQALEIPENAKLRERVLLAYHNRTLGKLHEIFDKPFSVDTLDNLQQFLEENWTLIKGSSLSYTAFPLYRWFQVLDLMQGNFPNLNPFLMWALTF